MLYNVYDMVTINHLSGLSEATSSDVYMSADTMYYEIIYCG